MATTDSLKERVQEAKKRLPKSGVSSSLMFRHPDLDRNRVDMVLQLRTTDEDITEKLEELADALEINN